MISAFISSNMNLVFQSSLIHRGFFWSDSPIRFSIEKHLANQNQSKVAEETIDSRDWIQPQIELLELIYFYGAKEMAKSLKLVHHIALYHSDFPLDDDEKSSLYDVITLSESLKKIKES